jgi:hypothetical protein
LGIAISSPTARLQINGSGTTTSTSSLLIRDGATTPRDIFKVDDSALVTIESSTTFSSRGASRLLSSSAATDSDFVISPKGTGAFIFGPPPDGTTTGGNSRGQNAVDLQILRASASQVASGQRSVIIGGQDNTASGISTGVFCAVTSSAITNYSVVIGGQTNTSAAQYALSAGRFALANLYACQSFASNQFAAQGDAMTLSWRYMREITGTGAQELTLDKATVSTQGRAILVANRLWNVNLQLSAICSTVGNGTLTLGDSYIATYQVGIKRLVNTTTLVGTVQNVITAQSDSGMSTSAVSITADDTNECLKIEFTPPSTAGTTTVIRVVVTATATELDTN